MVKFTSSLLVAAVVAPAFGAPVHLDAREPMKVKIGHVKSAAHTGSRLLAGTANTASNLATIHAAVTGMQTTRDFDELDARSPMKVRIGQVKSAAHTGSRLLAGAANTASNLATIHSAVTGMQTTRDFDEIDARNPMKVRIGGVKNAAHTGSRLLAGTANTASNLATIHAAVTGMQTTRDFDELDALL